jgi:3-methylfumaryl-CoA hydratase
MGSYDAWVGREQWTRDIVTAVPPHLLAASLDRDRLDFTAGDELPPLWHWLYFLRAVRTAELGSDGHPPPGDFLPAVPLSRRMRAGGQFEFYRSLHVGDAIERRSTIISAEEKAGKSGPLVFVLVQHEIFVSGVLPLVEQESIVYREVTPAPPFAAMTPLPAVSSAVPNDGCYRTSEVLLFRVSALMFNGHRIHYDRDYARDKEAYRNLVVQGPLIAFLMLEHLHSKHSPSSLRKFSYKAVAPTFCGDDMVISETFDPSIGASHVIARNGSGSEAVVGDASYGK